MGEDESNKGAQGTERVFENKTRTNTQVLSKKCQDGFFSFNGRCLQCPEQSEWNGANCVTKETVENNSTSENADNTTVNQVLDKLNTKDVDSQNVGEANTSGGEAKTEGG